MRILNDTSTSSPAAKSLSQRDRISYGVSTLQSLGLSRDQALGAMGSLAGESGRGLNTRAYNPKDPGTGSYGIGQWNKERRTALENFAKRPDQKHGLDDFRTQMNFIKHELQTTEKGTLAKMKAAPDRAKASDVWTKSYERPAAATAGYARRRANTEHFAGLMDGVEVDSTTETAYTDPQVSTAERDSMQNKKADPFGALFGNVDKAVTDVSNQFNGKGADPDRPVNHTVDHLGDIFGVSKKTDGEAESADSGFFGETSTAAMIGSIAGGLFAGPMGAVLGGLAGQGISKALDRLSTYQQTVADTAVTQGAAGGVGRQMTSFFGGIGNIFSPESAATASAARGGTDFAKAGDPGMDKNGFPTRPSGGGNWNGSYSSKDQNGNSWSGQAKSAISDSKSKGGPQGLY